MLHLLIGPVGAGKSTFARESVASSGGVFLDLDAWMVRLYGPDPRPQDHVVEWYLERRDRCRALMWDLTAQLTATGADVYLELGWVTAAERSAAYAQAAQTGVPVRVQLLDAPRDERRRRVELRNESNRPYTQLVPPNIFELASDRWEPLDTDERARWSIPEPSPTHRTDPRPNPSH